MRVPGASVEPGKGQQPVPPCCKPRTAFQTVEGFECRNNPAFAVRKTKCFARAKTSALASAGFGGLDGEEERLFCSVRHAKSRCWQGDETAYPTDGKLACRNHGPTPMPASDTAIAMQSGISVVAAR